MTTVTPSDRADASSSTASSAASAKRTGTVPGQRSGRAFRLLVLGTGDDADAFRERAALAGAQLAQRFSARVTHVVTEDGIGEQDARVVRARTAGVPVLGLADGERLLKDAETEMRTRDGAGDAPGNAVVPAEPDGEVSGGGAGGSVSTKSVEEEGEGEAERIRAEMPGSGVDADPGPQRPSSAAPEGLGEDSGQREPSLSPGEARPSAGPDSPAQPPVLSLVRRRTQFVPEPSDVPASEMFTDSALEVILHFPPLRGDDSAEANDARAGEHAEASAGASSEIAAGVRRSAVAERAAVEGAAIKGAVVEETGLRGGEVCGSDGDGCARVDGDGTGRETGRSAAGQEAAGRDAGASAGAGAGAGTSSGRVTGTGASAAASVAWMLLPLVSIGLLTPLGIGYAAYRLRSRAILVATACYTIAVAAAFAVSAARPMRTGAHAASGELLAACLAVSWLGGTAHSFVLRRRVFR